MKALDSIRKAFAEIRNGDDIPTLQQALSVLKSEALLIAERIDRLRRDELAKIQLSLNRFHQLSDAARRYDNLMTALIEQQQNGSSEDEHIQRELVACRETMSVGERLAADRFWQKQFKKS